MFALILPLLASFTEISDQSGLFYKNPDLAERKIAKIELDNGLQALLISDPKADQSAAALAVHAGSMMDPAEYPGMAHFCEHMLFLATGAYPVENEFHRVVQDFAGRTNAATWPDKTVYFFSSSHEGFLPLLDRWSHFFIDPTFNPSGVLREMHAIDQEFARQLQSDGWREHLVFKETANPRHPYSRFTTGNSQTLDGIPPAALREWHEKWYQAPQMRLLVYSNLPLDELKAQVDHHFSSIPNRGDITRPSLESFTTPEQRGHITYVRPVQETQVLRLSWEIPTQLAQDPSQPAELVTYALNRGQKMGLIEALKREGLADELEISVDDFVDKAQRFLEIRVRLSEKGLREIHMVAQRIFQALAGLKKQGIPSYLFEERNQANRLLYEFQTRQEAFSFVCDLAPLLYNEELSTFPARTLFSSRLEKKKIDQLLSALTPANCLFCVIADPEKSGMTLDRKEKWLGAEYTIRPLPATWLSFWQKASPHPDIQIAPPNPFLASDLEIASGPQTTAPILLSDVPGGIAYYWRGSEFGNPEVSLHLHLLSPLLTADAKSSTLTDLYLDHLERQLQPTLDAATQAGITAKLEPSRNRISIAISGLSEKSPVLLQEVLKELRGRPMAQEEFESALPRLQKNYAAAGKKGPGLQALDEFRPLAEPHLISPKEKQSTLATLTYSDYIAFHEKLWDKTYIQALLSGNLSVQAAEGAWLDIQSLLVKEAFPRELHPPIRAMGLPSEHGPYQITHPISAYGNAALLVLDEGSATFAHLASQQILGQSLGEPFFSELRTRQKTGYLVRAKEVELEGHLYQLFLVESNSHQPEDLLYRFELFLETFLEELKSEIPQERFDTLKRGVVDSLKNQYRSLEEKAALWDELAFERGGDFAFLDRRIASLEALDYATFLSDAKAYLSRANRKRLALLLTGETRQPPFAYQSITPATLAEIASYETSPYASPQSNGSVSSHEEGRIEEPLAQ